MKSLFSHLFTPQASNNYRPRLLHHSLILFLTIFFLASPIAGSYLKSQSVLGASTSISLIQLTLLTNNQRQASGLNPLENNQLLDKAAQDKANDMFVKNYWAHFAPDGTSPWFFIKNAGYDYVYAGENLAKGFNTSEDVVNAWMNSPTHRDNILSSNFEDVGFAISEGTLNGEYTTLVVQEFGGKLLVPPSTKKTLEQAESVESTQPKQSAEPKATLKPKLEKKSEAKVVPIGESILGIPKAISTSLSKRIVLAVVSIIIMILAVDMLLTHRRKVMRIAGHNLDHILLFVFIIVLMTYLFNGVIL